MKNKIDGMICFITTKKEQMLLAVWLLINLAIGLWLVQDYGISIDEPNYYRYADLAFAAYKSLFGLLYEPVYVFSNLHYYGPAFILIVKVVIDLFHQMQVNFSEIVVWHYSYYITFQLTGLCLYGLIRRWFKPWAAWGVLLLFITQPLLWGHAFINPKDIPFMFFFTFSIWVGYLFVDSLEDGPTSISIKENFRNLRERFESIDQKKRRTFLLWLLLIGVGLALFRYLALFIIEQTVRFFYFSPLDSWAAKLLRIFADHVTTIPVEHYITKAKNIYTRFDFILFVLGFVIMGGYLISLLTNIRVQVERFWQRFPLKNMESTRPFICHIRSKIHFQAILGFVRRTAKALATPKIILAGVVLGMTTSIRILGPLAGAIVIAYLLIQVRQRSYPFILAYLLWAGLVTYLTWPFLWLAPISNFWESLSLMSSFPWSGTALFDGKLYLTNELPVTYLPVLMSLQLTETLILLLCLGFGFFIWQLFFKGVRVDLLLYIGLGFLLPISVLMVLRSALYDNFRQILFLLPALFVFAAFVLEFLFNKIKVAYQKTGGREISEDSSTRQYSINRLMVKIQRRQYWLHFVLIISIIVPGLISLMKLHPYQYIYYNSFIGGVEGAFRRFEMDYWYTSLSELSSWVNENAEEGATVVVRVFPDIVVDQLRPDLIVRKIGTPAFDVNEEYDYAILTSRWNTDRNYPNAETILIVERDGAILGVLKNIKGQKLE